MPEGRKVFVTGRRFEADLLTNHATRRTAGNRQVARSRSNRGLPELANRSFDECRRQSRVWPALRQLSAPPSRSDDVDLHRCHVGAMSLIAAMWSLGRYCGQPMQQKGGTRPRRTPEDSPRNRRKNGLNGAKVTPVQGLIDGTRIAFRSEPRRRSTVQTAAPERRAVTA